MTLTSEPFNEPLTDAGIATALAAALAHARPPLQRTAEILSVAVSCSEAELREAVLVLDPDGVRSELDWNDFLALPVVERLGGRLRIVRPVDVLLATRLRERQPELFARAHEQFAEFERRSEDSDAAEDEIDGWQVKARRAYYLLQVDSDQASHRFIGAFDQAPLHSRVSSRLWLWTLTSRYTGIASEETRVGLFFEAFRLYTFGDRVRAGQLFEKLLEEERADRVAAVALHLMALCLPQDFRRQRAQLLDEAVRLSSELNLSENLLMSRNTLVWLHIARAQRGDPDSAKIAFRLADSNDRLADEMAVAEFQTATRRAVALAGWMAVAGGGHAKAATIPDHQLIDTIRKLAEAKQFAEKAHDLSAWVRASITEASVYRRAGKPDEALDSLAAATEEVRATTAIPELPVRQFEAEVDRLISEYPDDQTVSAAAAEVAATFRRVIRHR